MRYRAGYKYQLAEDEWFQTDIYPVETVDTEYIMLDTYGLMLVRRGYAWDGASGPIYDRRTNMRPSNGHDALYQLMRMGLLPPDCQEEVDRLYERWLIEDGTWEWWAKRCRDGLVLLGGPSASTESRKPVLEAP